MPAEAAQTAYQVSDIAFWSILTGSTIIIALAIEQIFIFWGLVAKARELGAEVGKVLYHGDVAAARTVCERSSSPIADVFIASLNKVNRPGQSVRKAAERERQRFRLAMKRRLWAMGTIGALAPFVGLLGTVVGIIRAFSDIAASEAGGFGVVASGVSQALWATAGGILVAILAVILFNFFQNRGNDATVEINLVVDEFLEQLEAAPISGTENPETPSLSNASASSPAIPTSVPLTQASEG